MNFGATKVLLVTDPSVQEAGLTLKDVGAVTIETGKITFDEDDCKIHLNCTPGDFAMLTLSDNGCGMDKQTAERIFAPFFYNQRCWKRGFILYKNPFLQEISQQKSDKLLTTGNPDALGQLASKPMVVDSEFNISAPSSRTTTWFSTRTPPQSGM